MNKKEKDDNEKRAYSPKGYRLLLQIILWNIKKPKKLYGYATDWS